MKTRGCFMKNYPDLKPNLTLIGVTVYVNLITGNTVYTDMTRLQEAYHCALTGNTVYTDIICLQYCLLSSLCKRCIIRCLI